MSSEASDIGICPHHHDCDRRFSDLERRMETLDGRWSQLHIDVTKVREKLAGLEGRIAGYLVAASLLGVCVAFIAAYVFNRT